jgi:hypothetical protein
MDKMDYDKQFKPTIEEAERLYDQLRNLDDPEIMEEYQGDLEDIINDPSISDAKVTLTRVKNALLEREEAAEVTNNLD